MWISSLKINSTHSKENSFRISIVSISESRAYWRKFKSWRKWKISKLIAYLMMCIKNTRNWAWTSAFKIICGTRRRNKFRSTLVPKRILKSNSSMKLYIKHSCSVYDTLTPDSIRPFFILLEWRKMISEIQG